MKIGVSNIKQSTLQPQQKEIILNYIHTKGYVLGKSEFKQVE